MTERMTRDITARITTMAIPMPFQFRGGPSELPRSWCQRERKHTYVEMKASTAEEEDISSASFPQSHKNFTLTVISAQSVSGGPTPALSITETSPNYTHFPYEKCIKLLHVKDLHLTSAAILASPQFFFSPSLRFTCHITDVTCGISKNRRSRIKSYSERADLGCQDLHSSCSWSC